MKTTEENNRLIAEFMEFHEIMLDEESRYDIGDIYDILEIDVVAIGTVAVSDLKFHTSWDWLMPCCISLKIDYICTDINEAYKTVLDEIKKRNLERH